MFLAFLLRPLIGNNIGITDAGNCIICLTLLGVQLKASDLYDDNSNVMLTCLLCFFSINYVYWPKYTTNIRAMKERLKHILSRRQKRHIVDNSRVSAAVLAPIYYKQGQYYILFTRRTEKVKEHKGQISFPGGAYQDSDGILRVTALRESTEEIGLMAEYVDVLGELDDEISLTSNYVISPFVGLIPWPYEFRLNRYETDEIIEAPISALLHEGCLYRDTEMLDGAVANSYTYHYEGTVIWGATARILSNFLDIFRQAMPKR